MSKIAETLLAAAAARQEEIEFHGIKVVVRELPSAADVEAFRTGEDAQFKWLTRCVFSLDGERVFSDEQIPQLKQSSRKKLMPLLMAVFRVNNLLPDDAAGNSEASPAGS